jgi:alpha-1,3-fucosyltransferase
MEMLDKGYKFYLSFENSLCSDYVTEKFWKILNFNIVPIVLGGANYEKV